MAATSYDFTFERSLDFVKAVRQHYFARQIRRPCIVFLPIGAIGFLGVCLRLSKTEFEYFNWFLILISVTPWFLLITHRWVINQIQLKGATSYVVVHLELDTISMRIEKSSSTVEWLKIKEMWKFDNLLLLFWGEKRDLNHAVALPVSAMNEETLQFIEERIKSSGGRIN